MQRAIAAGLGIEISGVAAGLLLGIVLPDAPTAVAVAVTAVFGVTGLVLIGYGLWPEQSKMVGVMFVGREELWVPSSKPVRQPTPAQGWATLWTWTLLGFMAFNVIGLAVTLTLAFTVWHGFGYVWSASYFLQLIVLLALTSWLEARHADEMRRTAAQP